MDPELARRRYQEFKEHVYDSLQSVKNKFQLRPGALPVDGRRC